MMDAAQLRYLTFRHRNRYSSKHCAYTMVSTSNPNGNPLLFLNEWIWQ
jgi:hypothetical protein